MTDHVHLLLAPDRQGIAAMLLKRLGPRYIQSINQSYRHSGSLLEGCSRSCLVQMMRLPATWLSTASFWCSR